MTWAVEDRVKGEKLHKPRWTVRIESTKIRWFLGQSDGRLDLMRGSQSHSELSWLKGGHAIRLKSNQIR